LQPNPSAKVEQGEGFAFSACSADRSVGPRGDKEGAFFVEVAGAVGEGNDEEPGIGCAGAGGAERGDEERLGRNAGEIASSGAGGLQVEGFAAGGGVKGEEAAASAVSPQEHIGTGAAVDLIEVRLRKDVPEGFAVSAEPEESLVVRLESEASRCRMQVSARDARLRPARAADGGLMGIESRGNASGWVTLVV
jgi:hypothetical protein